MDVDESSSANERVTDAKTRVLSQLAEKEKRENPIPQNSVEDELLAISKGTHPDQSSMKSGKVTKQGKKSKTSKKKQERAEMIKDMLAEKVTLAKQRHKTVRGYRKKDEDEEN